VTCSPVYTANRCLRDPTNVRAAAQKRIINQHESIGNEGFRTVSCRQRPMDSRLLLGAIDRSAHVCLSPFNPTAIKSANATRAATRQRCGAVPFYRSYAWPSQAEPSRAEPSRAEPSRAEPSRAEPSRAEPSRAEPALRWCCTCSLTPHCSCSADTITIML
jgi:hypothetical protein